MKRCSNVNGWTDYPFTRLGDVAHTKAPIRHVEVIKYDGNKYATVLVEGLITSIKWAYIYQRAGRLGQVKTINRRKLERMKPHRLDHCEED